MEEIQQLGKLNDFEGNVVITSSIKRSDAVMIKKITGGSHWSRVFSWGIDHAIKGCDGKILQLELNVAKLQTKLLDTLEENDRLRRGVGIDKNDI